MYAALFTLILLPGVYPHAGNVVDAGGYGAYCGTAACSPCGHWRHVGGGGGILGSMPQSCYSPRYGAYPGNARHIHRYPAFHGHYYRRPYNYRNVFDYPWHARPHEPEPFFLHRQGATPQMEPQMAPQMTPQMEPQMVPQPGVVPPAPSEVRVYDGPAPNIAVPRNVRSGPLPGLTVSPHRR